MARRPNESFAATRRFTVQGYVVRYLTGKWGFADRNVVLYAAQGQRRDPGTEVHQLCFGQMFEKQALWSRLLTDSSHNGLQLRRGT